MGGGNIWEAEFLQLLKYVAFSVEFETLFVDFLAYFLYLSSVVLFSIL